MKNLVTIIFNSYHSKFSLLKVLKSLNEYKIIIIENSLDLKLKNNLEKKFKNVNVIIPNKNLGLSAGYNLGIKLAKTKYVFLNNPDIKISCKSIKKIINFAEKIKKFGVIAPTYDNEKIYKNYSKFHINFNKNISSVLWIDNNFLINKSNLKKNIFDEKYFLYFETIDFCLNLFRKNNELYVLKKVKFKHYGSTSVDKKLIRVVQKTRAWHYNWSKFYYYKKNFNYIYALTKIFPNLINALKSIAINLTKLKYYQVFIGCLEIYGILTAISFLPSFYRAKK